MEIRSRLFSQVHRRKNEEVDQNRPRLRTSPGAGTIPADEGSPEKDKQDDRPTLKRREWVE